MDIKVFSGKINTQRVDALFIPVFSDKKNFSEEVEQLDLELNNAISKLKKDQKFNGDLGKSLVVPTFGKLKAKYIVLIGAGSKKKADLDIFRRVGANAVKVAKGINATKILFDLKKLDVNENEEDLAQAIVEGIILGSYSFDKYKSKKDDFEIKSLNIRVSKKHKEKAEEKVELGKILAESQNFTRDLVNTPPNVINPEKLAEIALELGKEYGIEVKVYDEEECEKMGMNAYLAVAKGSANPPRFIHLVYKGKNPKEKIALVGKGLTFDSGGLNIKPGDYMRWMKSDKSGACAVLGIFKALGQLKPEGIEVHGVIAAAENMPDGKAYRPDDILTAKNGVTIEVGNTDAEGRLTLADALCYASEQEPDILIDMATLTGACVVALGEYTAGIMGNDQKLINNILKVSEKTGEWMWQLPFNDMLRESIKAPNADVYNIGKSRYGGAITAGLFLEKFVPENIPWAHIDIAGPAHTTSGWYYHPKGGTGFPVRTITQFLLKKAK
ncbi:leucyl aminopeptidase [Hydrogenothermus marinus]|uniref:Probable cytosol aminopeptidase n=1 Tax=Hydrogenothermus marinus TaxID=133270 RepID=A0A3M0BKK3_9AQUI|nr:leucyl aminopeptidase [Hydrogenothermus marinus]RMA97156.1 leucyl aminopeptidase [Hydrogenothermus marinus]